MERRGATLLDFPSYRPNKGADRPDEAFALAVVGRVLDVNVEECDVDRLLRIHAAWQRAVTWESVSEECQQRVLDAILSGALLPGEKLPLAGGEER